VAALAVILPEQLNHYLGSGGSNKLFSGNRKFPHRVLFTVGISLSTLAIIVVVAIINVGHHCGRCRRQHQLGHLQSHCCY
jgi:hypothetical protein